MITLKELQAKSDTIDKNHWANVEEYLTKINEFRQAYGKPMIVNSFYRSKEKQIEIYLKKGITKPPMGSMHLQGLACDFRDIDGKIYEFCQKNTDLLDKLGFWVEHRKATPSWCHLQIRPPKSGNRFFMP